MTSDALKSLLTRLASSAPPVSPERRAQLEREEHDRLRAEHEERQVWATGDHLRACGVKPELLDALLRPGDLKPSQARTRVQEFLARPDRHLLVLLGMTSVGKSLAACEAFLSLKQRFTSPYFGESWQWGWPGVFVRANHLASLSNFGDGREEFLKLLATPLLVVDEVGGERTALEPVLDELVDERYAQRRKTILTSNLTMDEFRERYGSRVAERLRHRGQVVECVGASFRSGRAG